MGKSAKLRLLSRVRVESVLQAGLCFDQYKHSSTTDPNIYKVYAKRISYYCQEFDDTKTAADRNWWYARVG